MPLAHEGSGAGIVPSPIDEDDMIRSPLRLTALAAMVALAISAAGCLDEPTQVSRDARPPAEPQGLYSVTGDGQVNLYWVRNTEPDFREYLVWRGPAFDGPYAKIGNVGSPAFVDQTPSNGQTYYYAVSAVDQAGNESDLSKEEVFDTPRPAGFGLVLVNAAGDPSGPSAYDFSSGTRRLSTDPSADFYYTVSGGVRLLVARDSNTEIQDAGFHSIDDLDFAPAQGWSPTHEVEAVVGHAYYVWTRDDHYAKVRIGALDASQATLDWAYQIAAGNPELHPQPGPRP